MRVEGNCSIKYISYGLRYKHSLTIKGESDATLNISPVNHGAGEYFGIFGMGYDSPENICFEGNGENHPFIVSVEAYSGEHAGRGISSQNGGGVLNVAENAEVTFKGSSNDAAGFVEDYGIYAIYGKLVVDNAGSGPALKINDGNTFITDVNTEIFLRTKEGPAIRNGYEAWFTDEQFGSYIKTAACDQYTEDYSAITGGLKINGFMNGIPGKSFVYENNRDAKSVLIRGTYTVEFDGLEGCTEKVFKGSKAKAPDLVPVDPNGGKFNSKWYVNKDYDNAWDFGDVVYESMKLYPGFLYTVEFDTDGGKSGPKAEDVLIGHSLIQPKEPIKDGYVFGYWSADADKSYGDAAEWDFQTVIDKNMTLYAKWTQNEPGVWRVNFNSRGGSSVPSQKVENGTRVRIPDDPVRKGYIFKGWYKDIECENKYDFATSVTGNITLYAKWESTSDDPVKPVEDDVIVSEEYIDRDTYKSEYPGGTVIAMHLLDANHYYDMKVHPSDTMTVNNQELLANLLLGADFKPVITKGIFMRSDLPTYEDGEMRILKWKNLPINTAGAVKAVVYNAVDGAYVIDGVVDAKGTATFAGFKLRTASNITICR